MRRTILVMAIAAVAMTACKNSRPACSLEQDEQTLDSLYMAIWEDSTLTEDEQMQRSTVLFEEAYRKHPADSLGLYVFKSLICSFWQPDKALAEFDKADDMIRNSADMQRRITAIRNRENTAAGKMYMNVSGPDALTGDSLSISDILSQGKPVIVDFWASWCSPCRQEIKRHLLDIADAGKYNIVGIAVWEDSVEDTRRAMDELGVCWPVIYTGGRENSPSMEWGVVGIPTLFLINPDGTFGGSGHSVEDFLTL